MDSKEYIKLHNESNKRQLRVYLERNKDYAQDDDVLLNDYGVHLVCLALGIDVLRSPEEADWFRLADKLVRERNKHKRDNLDDAINYLRRIMAWENEK